MLFFRLFLIERGEHLPHAGQQDSQVRRVKGQRGTEPENLKKNRMVSQCHPQSKL